MSLQKLSDSQNGALKRLETKLQVAAYNGNLKAAKDLIQDIKTLLRPHGYETRLMQAKNWLYEASIEAGDYPLAIEGLKIIKQKTNKNTRVHLEATALLAIAHLRSNAIDKAEPFVKEVLTNDKVIKSEKKRTEFRKSIIQRFNEEVSLSSLKGLGDEVLDVEEITTQAQKLLEKGKDELLKSIGNATPSNVVTSILQIDSFSKNQLSSAEKLKLPSPTEQIQDDKVGETIFSSFKRTIYKSLCDPESDIYKAWFTNGVNSLLSKKYITGAVVSTLAGLGVGIKMIAASITALILKFGIEVYCAHKKPKGVMEMR